MVNRLIYRFLTILSILLISLSYLYGQEPEQKIQRSSEKVIIGGKIYYIHVVEKGQTLYSISKAYNVPEKEISSENPVLVTGLQAGMVLKIPFVPASVTNTEQEARDTQHYIYYRLAVGETLFSVSRKYGVTVDEILHENPDLSPDNIPADAEIRIPRKKIVPEHIGFAVQEEPSRMHHVLPGETLFSIARKYGITVRDIRKLNKGLKNDIVPGQEIRIPSKEENVQSFPSANDTVHIQAVSAYPGNMPCDTTGYLGADRVWKVALMLPFYLKENERSYIDSSTTDPSTGKKIRKIITRDPDWIYPPTINFLSFYEGVMLALDTLGKTGIHAQVSVFDTERDISVVDSLVKTGALDSMDLIIGPVYPVTLSVIAQFGRMRHIPVVSPLSRRDDFLHFNPFAFQFRPSKKLEQRRMANYLARNFDNNIVVIHTDDSVAQKEYNRIKDDLVEAFSQYVHPEDASIKEVVVPQLLSPADTMNNIEISLDKYRQNIVWVLSDQEGFVSEIVSRLSTLMKNYPIQLAGSSDWRYFENVQLEYFYQMNLHLFTPQFINPNGKKEKLFFQRFRKKYYTDPAILSIAWDGYDIAAYFLSILNKYGTAFADCTGSFYSPICIGNYQFKRTGWFSGFMNQIFYMLQYNKNFSVSLVSDVYKP